MTIGGTVPTRSGADVATARILRKLEVATARKSQVVVVSPPDRGAKPYDCGRFGVLGGGEPERPLRGAVINKMA